MNSMYIYIYIGITFLFDSRSRPLQSEIRKIFPMDWLLIVAIFTMVVIVALSLMLFFEFRIKFIVSCSLIGLLLMLFSSDICLVTERKCGNRTGGFNVDLSCYSHYFEYCELQTGHLQISDGRHFQHCCQFDSSGSRKLTQMNLLTGSYVTECFTL
uniref:Uncharacterized protein n=1 Tax=Trichobilharzia regenti TaxID=157069 RepID=A0AA85J1E7_TRIRE|nr:unnamed protein product [Trichobilharzia regenti]